jgi:hypothetical protein
MCRAGVMCALSLACPDPPDTDPKFDWSACTCPTTSSGTTQLQTPSALTALCTATCWCLCARSVPEPSRHRSNTRLGACASSGTTTSSGTACTATCVSGYVGTKVAQCNLGLWSVVGSACKGMQQQAWSTSWCGQGLCPWCSSRFRV